MERRLIENLFSPSRLPGHFIFYMNSKHEHKFCPRCSSAFECKPGSINQCQCSGIQLTEEERVYIEIKHDDCLCINCLKALQHQYIAFTQKHIFK